MGRSSKKNSCLRIITCSRGDEVADDDSPLTSSQTQRTEKRRWSFRKKSAEHQVGSSIIISETVTDSLDPKYSEQTVPNNIQCPKNSSVSFSENLPLKDIHYDIPEASLVKSAPNDVQHLKPEISLVPVEPEIVEKHVEVEISKIKEFSVVQIQAFIRGYLVRRELPKFKNVIKLQAAVRGHLVRRQAVGTLRCSLAILKMQALIRAHHARVYLKKSGIKQQERTSDIIKLDKSHTSAKSLISNGFANRLLDLSPKTKPIYISCDHSKSNSAWQWFERWMAVTATKDPKTAPKFYETHGTVERVPTSTDSKLAGDDVTSENSSGDEFHDPLLCPEIANQGAIDVKNEIDTSSKVHTENAAFAKKMFDVHHEKNDAVDDSFKDNLETKTTAIIDGNAVSHNLTPQIDASECGTEISISSTLDSPDRSEAEGEILIEFGSLENEHNVVNGHSNILTEKAEEKVPAISQDHTEPKKLDVSDKKLDNTVTSLNTDLQSQVEFTTTTSVENGIHGTPASQKTVNEKKKNKRETKKTDGKAIAQTAKKSPLNITKDSNNMKRRNSLGMDSKLDHVDQEPRMSNSSVPSYMQATESARAKANANVSPRSSPDLYNKESQLKKRHSLPMVFGKQGSSPRIQKSPSQSDKNPKGNAHSPINSAERRWQR